jgi:glutamate dehydrogenase
MSKTPTGRVAPVAAETQAWLESAMPPYFFDAMTDEPEAMAILARELGTLSVNDHLVLADRPTRFVLATRNVAGSLYRSLVLGRMAQPAISYAMFAHSIAPMPGLAEALEIQRFDFECKTDAEIAKGLEAGVRVPADVRRSVTAAVEHDYPDVDKGELDRLLSILWLNNPSYVRISPGPEASSWTSNP